MGPYQAAIVRIGFAGAWLIFLLREWPNRQELYGPDSPWSWHLAEELIANNNAFSVLMWSQSNAWFESVYLLAVLSSVALMIGWRTRTMSVLFMIGVLSLQNRSIFMGDGSDNVIHLMAIYLVLTRCAQVWSLDARRAARTAARGAGGGGAAERDLVGMVLWAVCGAALVVVTLGPGLSGGWALIYWGLWLVAALWWAANRFAPGEPRTVLDVIANLVHNATLVVIMFEVCLIYSTAGWYKIQGSRWQDGTAAYYPMKLDYFAPWPELNDVFAGNGLIIMVMTYLTVMVQVAFPFTLFNRKVKNILLAVMIAEHLSIAVLLGLPIFSLAMIAADAVFLPTAALLWMGARSAGLTARLRRAFGGATGATAQGGGRVPGQARRTGQAEQPGQPGQPVQDGQTERQRDADTTVTLPR
ncbi:HTTM domain-containing protein [Streptomyces sp. N2-109]|uniref:HTTM domain-containing protein n=1 Tax=Streptomyces gossypii TaxID=2883101 RepID=A0ABT2JMK0_9ACTN|nr:HTTM domain-containing protein [Streptomyces gossypii]MCT2589112.1 HTTM domain-containing protein [Streptomyces gossypii]